MFRQSARNTVIISSAALALGDLRWDSCACVFHTCVFVRVCGLPGSAAPPPIQVDNCCRYQLVPLISVISLAVGNKGLIGADGLQPARPLSPFTFPR